MAKNQNPSIPADTVLPMDFLDKIPDNTIGSKTMLHSKPMARIGPVWYLVEGLKLPPKETAIKVAEALRLAPAPWEADFLKRMKDQNISINSVLASLCETLKSEIITIYKLKLNTEQSTEFGNAIIELFSWKVFVEIFEEGAKSEGRSPDEIIASKESVIAQMMLIGFEQMEHGIPQDTISRQLQVKF